MANPRTYHFELPPLQRPPEVPLNDPWYPGVQAYWRNCTSRRLVDPIHGVTTVVIHATAGSSSEGAVSVMKRQRKPASFHWLIPDEDEPQHGQFVWACVPEALAAWHVRNDAYHPDLQGGERRVNHWSLGIELVNAQTSVDGFSVWQLEMAARIVRYCWAKYPNLRHVISHAKLDPQRRTDPGARFDWVAFRQRVLDTPSDGLPPLVASARGLDEVAVAQDEGCCGYHP